MTAVRRSDNGVFRNVLACFHRTAGYKDRRNVEAHRCDQHAGRDLVTVGNAHHCIGTVCVHHILDRIRDHFA